MLPCLVQMSSQGLTCFGIVIFGGVLGEHRPPHEVPGLDPLDPYGFGGRTAHHVHPLDGLLG